jgi:hypothetical protein
MHEATDDQPVVEDAIRARLQEIEQRLASLQDLERERARLSAALAVLRGDLPTEGSVPMHGARRAPRGANQDAIVAYVEKHQDARSGDIAEATQIARPIVYSALARLTAVGRLERRTGTHGEIVYRLPAATT